MSTTFGIKVKGYAEPIEVAHRYGIGNGQIHIDILNPLVLLLPDYIHVEPLDNTAQGIECIGDIKKAIMIGTTNPICSICNDPNCKGHTLSDRNK